MEERIQSPYDKILDQAWLPTLLWAERASHCRRQDSPPLWQSLATRPMDGSEQQSTQEPRPTCSLVPGGHTGTCSPQIATSPPTPFPQHPYCEG